MQLLWKKARIAQLDLLGARLDTPSSTTPASALTLDALAEPPTETLVPASEAPAAVRGLPLLVPIESIDKDPNNPRTEFLDAEIDELAEDIRQHGILQPLTVHPADAHGRYRIHFGAKRWRAARRAGLAEVPVVVRDAPADPYAQVAENQKRHGLTPLDLARFIRKQADAGDSNATIAKKLGMDQTVVAHHLTLLELPPVLNEALQSGRCTSPRTLHELSKLHRDNPLRVEALVEGDAEITRTVVSAVRAESSQTAHGARSRPSAPALLARAEAACGRLEQALDRLARVEPRIAEPELARLRQRVASLASRLA